MGPHRNPVVSRATLRSMEDAGGNARYTARILQVTTVDDARYLLAETPTKAPVNNVEFQEFDTRCEMSSLQRITRHKLSIPVTEEDLAYYDRLIDIKQEQIDSNVGNFSPLMDAPFRAAGYLQALHPEDKRLTHYLRLGAKVTLAGCRLAEPGQGSLNVDFGLDRTHQLPYTPDPLLDVIELMRGLFAALAVGDAETASALARVDLALLWPEGVKVHAWGIDWARSVQGFVRGADWAGEAFACAIKGADPAQYPDGSSTQAYCAGIAHPLMALCLATLRTPTDFNSELRDTLEAHRIYYGQLQFDPPLHQDNSPEGFIALGALAFSVAMSARGWPITVESDYLPRSLIDGPAR